ncbi:hypothetical protein [Rhodococcus spongiicola]|uniref:Uncharacterized protein n=1 Tax=Rhodococcus spongiicola TaxID=2487352 RepID=A0A3S3AQU7_9NOCA|nr:hypothetical protein [Rhodococcus spongiicola]RVW06246.1 hypothetical protein EF834_01970 [Rhodococcus spongiicola]
MSHIVHLTRVGHSSIGGSGTAADAIRKRAARLRESGTPFERDGMTLRFKDSNGADVTLSYEEVLP